MDNDATLILSNLWVGNYKAAHSTQFIRSADINVIINVTPDICNVFNDIKYFRIPVKNKAIYINFLRLSLLNIYALIDMCVTTRVGLLVHCKSGHRRSIIIVAYYLMRKFGLSLDEVKRHLKSKRTDAFKQPLILEQALVKY